MHFNSYNVNFISMQGDVSIKPNVKTNIVSVMTLKLGGKFYLWDVFKCNRTYD